MRRNSCRQAESGREEPVDRMMTPYEALYMPKPEISHLRVFGSVCHIHVHDAKRITLEERAAIGIFLGYNNVVKAYRIYNLKTKRIQISRNVRIDEGLAWNWEK